MQVANNLKIIATERFKENTVELKRLGEISSHSLHYSIAYKDSLNPAIPAFFIDKYSKEEDVVLDPFCGFGIIPLEAVLKKRFAFAFDARKLATAITKAKLNPAPISQVVFELQKIDIKRLVRLGDFENYFSSFFDIETYKEILAVREYIQKNKYLGNNVIDYIEFILSSILHGPNQSFCSVPTYQEISLMPKEQDIINSSQRVHPEYRSIVSRIIKKASICEKDLFPSFMEKYSKESIVQTSDARNLKYVSSSSVDLVLTEIPMFFDNILKKDYWIKNWFYNIDENFSQDDYFYDIESWFDFINEFLMECARVLKEGKKVVLIIKEPVAQRFKEPIYKVMIDFINKNLSRFFFVEKCLIEKDCEYREENLAKNSKGIRERKYRYLVLRKN